MDPFRKRSDFKVNIKEFEREGKKIHGRFVNFWDRPDLEEIPDIVEPSMAWNGRSNAWLWKRM